MAPAGAPVVSLLQQARAERAGEKSACDARLVHEQLELLNALLAHARAFDASTAVWK